MISKIDRRAVEGGVVGRQQARRRHVGDAGGGGQCEAVGRIIQVQNKSGFGNDLYRAIRVESKGAETKRIAGLSTQVDRACFEFRQSRHCEAAAALIGDRAGRDE